MAKGDAVTARIETIDEWTELVIEIKEQETGPPYDPKTDFNPKTGEASSNFWTSNTNFRTPNT